MKNAIFLILLSFIFKFSFSQTIDTLFYESFDSLPWKMNTYAYPTATADDFDTTSQVTHLGSLMAATGEVGESIVSERAENIIQTPNLGITGSSTLSVEFAHICYIGQFEEMRLQFSFDKGLLWQNAKNSMHLGNSFMQGGNHFNKVSSPFDWHFSPVNDTNFIWTNSNAAWAVEIFDFSGLVSNLIPAPDSIMFRIVLKDQAQVGDIGTHRYYLDDFLVKGNNSAVGLNKEVNSALEYSLAPNPVNDQLFLQTEIEMDGVLSIRNLEGKHIKTIQLNGLNRQRIDVSGLSAGVYFITVQSDGESKVLKFIKE